ncbi:protein DMP2-like [Gastrolobium bilobum]|uniref:protein DMP2-like n=1 Tax=Gastrolobium bilobum TaxID=150636 RepID=UPI002AAFEFF3|nr:protein DMP2-like [Gastrolobium bilobum]
MDEYYYFFVINAILSGTARLNVLLPIVTTLAFSIFAPILTNDGECSTLNRLLMGTFLFILAVSCVLFTFTDAFRRQVYYKVATFRGIWTFYGGKKKLCVPSEYRLNGLINSMHHYPCSLFLLLAGLHFDDVTQECPER